MKFFISLIMLVGVLFSETQYAIPKPSMDNPRKIVFSITSGDDEIIHHVLGSANNVLKAYGPENVEMEIVAYSKGINMLLKNDRKIAERVDTLMQYDVVFIACENTMRTKNIKESDLIDGTEIVTAGIVELVERMKDGWVHVNP